MKTPLLIYGAGGFGREVLSLVRALDDFEVTGFLDDGLSKNTVVKGIKVLGGMEVLAAIDGPVHVVLAFGDPVAKQKVAKKIVTDKVVFPALRHPSVILQDADSIRLGKGSILCAGSVLTTDIVIGDHVLINLNCTIGHDSSVGNFSSLMPGVNVAGEVAIGESALIGSGSTILNRLIVGDNSVVGMGSVVIRRVEASTRVAGVPAKCINVLSTQTGGNH